MRVQCPHCQKTVTLDNSKAEQPTPCPECGHIFTAPALLNALPDEPPPPEPPAPVAVPPVAAAPPKPEPVAEPLPSGPVRFRVRISKRAAHFFGPIALLVLFIATFFSWVVAAPGGNTVYSQSAWGLMCGLVDSDPAGDAVLQKGKELHEAARASIAMVLVLIPLLLPGVLIGLGDLFEQYITFPIPDIINKLWPKRLIVLTIATGLMFVLLTMQIVGSLGLEAAATAMLDANYARAANAPAENAEQRLERKIKRGEDYGRLCIQRTGALAIAYLASGVAVCGFALETVLERRRKKFDPVIELHW